MTALFDRLVVTALPLVPRGFVRRVASRYVAGDTLDDALATVRALSAEGAMATLDILGESVTRPEQADTTLDQYLRMIDAIAASGLPANISVKPTAVGLAIDQALALRNCIEICARASAPFRSVSPMFTKGQRKKSSPGPGTPTRPSARIPTSRWRSRSAWGCS